MYTFNRCNCHQSFHYQRVNFFKERYYSSENGSFEEYCKLQEGFLSNLHCSNYRYAEDENLFVSLNLKLVFELIYYLAIADKKQQQVF